MAEFHLERDAATGDIRFRGSLTANDLQRVRLDHIERAQLDSEAETAADYLLDLEVIFRRLAEQDEAAQQGERDDG